MARIAAVCSEGPTLSSTQSTHWIEELGLDGAGSNDAEGPTLYRSEREIDTKAPALYAHSMRRAWQALDLDAIFCIDRRPVVYLKEVHSIDEPEVARLHRILWNHGTAALLAIVTPKEVRVYSALALPSSGKDKKIGASALAKVFRRVADALDLRQFLESVVTGAFFDHHRASFNPKQRVDRFLLQNLEAARRLMLEQTGGDLDAQTVHAFLGRTIFVCYLVDRKIIGPGYFEQIGAPDTSQLLDILEDRARAGSLLYGLFEKLKEDFNGDLFNIDLTAEQQRIGAGHLDVLRRFLRGDQLENQQLSLGFWAYDFSIIPIETISAIYESFLTAEDEKAKKQTGAFYTPRFLAEVVIDTALAGWQSILDKRFLDPACGSGIFLVGLFNRLAEEWRRANPAASYAERAHALLGMLQEQLFGVDSNLTACRITAFSLYLALLDQFNPPDIQQFQKQGHWLPPLLGDPLKTKGVGSPRPLLNADFFAPDLKLPVDSFDLVLGNPSWARDLKALSSVVQWSKKERVELPQKQLAYAFVWKAPDLIRKAGRVCFLLPAALLFNRAKNLLDFQRKWLERDQIDQIINLSDLRLYLMDGATHPAFIARYRKKDDDAAPGFIDYLVPKSGFASLHADVLSINPEDRIEVRVDEVLDDLQRGEFPSIWKQAMWGSPRDRRLQSRLSLLPRLGAIAGKARERKPKRWVIGQGFQPESPSSKRPIPRPWPPSHLMLEGKTDLNLVLPESDCGAIGDKYSTLRRLPDERIFKAPHTLVSQGFRMAFADFDVVFRHAIQGIHGPEQDAELLMFLAAALDSPLGRYFFFHTAGSWGTERDKVLEEELLLFPFPLPDTMDDSFAARRLISKVSRVMTDAKRTFADEVIGRDIAIARVRDRIRPLVYEYYGIGETEAILIEDTINVWEPSSTPQRGTRNIPAIRRSSVQERAEYMTTLAQTLNEWASGGRYRILARQFARPSRDAAIVELTRTTAQTVSGSNQPIESDRAFDAAILRIQRALPERQGHLRFQRGLKVFAGDNLYILKPLDLRFWTATAALNDADEIAAAILSGHGG